MNNLNMLEETKTKKIRLSRNLSRQVGKEEDEERVNEILTSNYRRFVIENKIRETLNEELEKILKMNKVIAMYKLESDLAKISVYALICKGARVPYELKDISKGTTVGIYGSFKEAFWGKERFLYILINLKSEMSLMFVHPDFYVNITFITDKTSCFRKYSLAQKYFGSGRINEELGSIGTMKHNIFETILLSEKPIEDFDGLVDRQIILEKDFFCQLDKKDLQHYRNHLVEMVNRTLDFKKRYIENKQQIKGHKGDFITIKQILASEYSLNSLKFSMKGKIDLLLKVCYFESSTDEACIEMIIPFELKTGKKYIEFEDQVMLYSVCYHEDFIQGHFSLLFFSETGEFGWVQNDFEKLTHLARRRNEIAAHLAAPKIPAPIENSFVCNRFCSQNRNCAFESFLDRFEAKIENSKLLDIEEMRKDNHPVIEEHVQQIQKGQLTLAKLSYAKYLMNAIKKEELAYLRDSFLDYDSALTFVFANLYIMYQLHIRGVTENTLISFDLYFAVSDRNTVMDYLQGISINGDLVFVHKKNPDLKFEGKVKNLHIINSPKISVLKVTFRVRSSNSISKVFSLIENDPEFFVKYSTDWIINQNERTDYIKMRTNIVNCITTIEDHELMDVVIASSMIEAKKMEFEKESDDHSDLATLLKDPILSDLSSFALNAEQASAIHRIFTTPHFFLLQGFPGCGKTHTISVLLALMLRTNKRVLISCHTHKALNVVLENLQGLLTESERSKVLRLIPDRESAGLDNFEVYSSDKVKTVADYQNFINRSIFACTLLSIDRFKFKAKDFDYVIIDECTQIFEPLLLKPLALGKKFVLIGDYLQYSPLTRVKVSVEEFDLNVSLFQKICQRFPSHTLTLTSQFRMNADIMYVANRFIYNGQLKSASMEISGQQLRLSYAQFNLLPNWLKDALYPKNFSGVTFIDTCGLMPQSFSATGKVISKSGTNLATHENSILNFSETLYNGLSEAGNYKDEHTAVEVLKALLKGGVSKEDIVIITSFNRQRECIMSSMPDFLNVTTIDRCQGIDSKVVILVLTVDRISPRFVSLLIQRTNTAITRAREKLIIIGGMTELKAYPRLYDLLKIAAQKEWIVRVVKHEEERFFEALEEKKV